MEVAIERVIEWAGAATPRGVRDPASGRCVVETYVDGALAVLVHAQGAGHEAAWAAAACAELLRDRLLDPLEELMQRCHARLRLTTGTTLALARFDGRRDLLAWLATGRCAAAVLRANATLPPRERTLPVDPALLGRASPELRPLQVALEPDDTLLVVSGAAETRFPERLDMASPQALVTRLLAVDPRDEADGVALAVRYLGGER